MPIPLRADFDAQMVRAAARRSKDGPQARRLLALAAIYEGASRTEAAKVGGPEPDFLKNIMGACSGSADVGVAAIGAGAPDRMKLGTLM